jgi:phage terminase small subunit
MGKPRKPTALLEASGAFKKNPARGRARENEPVQREKLGPAPRYLSQLQRACWNRIVALCPDGVLKAADEPIVELTAGLWAKSREGMATAADCNQLKACLQQLGMTPAARSLVQVVKVEEGNEFDE